MEALKEGLVDSLGGLDETLAYIDEHKLVQKAGKGMSGRFVYADLKREMYRETLGYLENFGDDSDRDFARAQLVKKEKEAAVKKVKDWEIKAKL